MWGRFKGFWGQLGMHKVESIHNSQDLIGSGVGKVEFAINESLVKEVVDSVPIAYCG